MKPIIIVFNNEERRYIVQFNSPIYFEVDNPCGVLLLTITEEKTENKIEIPIEIDPEYTSLHLSACEETSFDEEAIEMVYDAAQEWILNYLNNEEKVLCANELISNLKVSLHNLTDEIAKKHPEFESYKRHVESVEHPGAGYFRASDTPSVKDNLK